MTGSYHRKTRTEEFPDYVMLPDNAYLGHISRKRSTSEGILNSILELFAVNTIDASELCAIGCDGTAVNTESRGGVILRLEKVINRPLQWLICQLHGNELPLRHLMEYLDGPTSGPGGFSGPIGKRLTGSELLSVMNYVAIDSSIQNMPAIDRDSSSTDQKYLLEIFEGVVSGDCPIRLSERASGALNHSTWPTTVNRILRLYIGTEYPSAKLKTLVSFIM